MANSCETCAFVGYSSLKPSTCGQAHQSRTFFHGYFGGNNYMGVEETKDVLLER